MNKKEIPTNGYDLAIAAMKYGVIAFWLYTALTSPQGMLNIQIGSKKTV